jgi:site-specific DNA-methyltransferase (adenine-specific)
MNYELKLGDTLERMKDIPDGSIDMILCDLPYGTTACKWDSVSPFEPLWEAYRRVTKKNAAIVLTASQPFTSVLGASRIGMLQYSWYWQKTRATGHLNAKKRPMKDIEDVLIFYRSQPTYNPQGLIHSPRKVQNSASDMARGVSTDACATVTGGITVKEYEQEFTNYPRQVLAFPSEGGTKHPTQKPVALMEYLIKTYTNPGELVLDNTMGSGTTGVACMNTGRRFIGIERDEKYFAICRERIHRAYVDSIDI